MSTTVRSKISKSNPYYISKHRYLELKHFCLQYPEWRKKYANLQNKIHPSTSSVTICQNIYEHSDKTAQIALDRAYYHSCMRLIENTADNADCEIGDYIFKAVTEGYSYNYLKTVLSMPCGRDMYYNRYRKFFWLLDKTRN